jgi:hypothetical protein
MAPLGFIEILDGRGHVSERVACRSLPVHLGRAYRNEVVLDDPYVCPVHARIERDEDGRLCVRDLGSLNGLRAGASGARVTELELRSGTEFRVGRTRLRFLSVDHPVAPAWVDREGRLYSPGSPTAAIIAAVIVFLLLTLESFLGSIEYLTFAKLVSEPLLTLSMLLTWCGLWSLASRIVVGRFNFSGHGVVASGAAMAFTLVSASAEWIQFILPAVPALWLAGVFGSAAILAALVYGHLGLASPMRRRSRLWASLLVSAATIGLSTVVDFASRSRFSNVMEYAGIVKPLDPAWLPADSIDQFIENSDKLKKDLDALAIKSKMP